MSTEARKALAHEVCIRLLTSLLDTPLVKTNHGAMLRVSDREDRSRVDPREWDSLGDIDNNKQELRI